MRKLIEALFAPVPGAQRWFLSVYEAFRSLLLGSGTYVIVSVLTYVMTHTNELHIPPAVAEEYAGMAGLAVFALHLAVQVWQEDKSRPPAPPAAPDPK